MKKEKTKIIVLNISEEVFKELGKYMLIRKMTGHTVSIDYEFIVTILQAIIKKQKILIIRKINEKE